MVYCKSLSHDTDYYIENANIFKLKFNWEVFSSILNFVCIQRIIYLEDVIIWKLYGY